MLQQATPTSQKADVRPISFVLQTGYGFDDPVTLVIRPEDLTRSETSRSTVHQTLGRGDVTGWVDSFGMALPTCAISGHTGWRSGGVNGEDGVAGFMRLHDVVMPRYHDARQEMIDSGQDPSGVKLLFVDMLDDFAWTVEPMGFVLKRNRSRPLLMQYSINLQAISTSIDDVEPDLPFMGSITGGLNGLGSVLQRFPGYRMASGGLLSSAAGFNGGFGGLGGVVGQFLGAAGSVFANAYDAVRTSAVGAAAGGVISMAADVAGVGANAFRTFAGAAGLPSGLRGEFGMVSGSFNEVLCLTSNSLRPRGVYEDFDGLFGASNCSSTTGGRPASIYAGSNPFALMGTAARAADSVLTASIAAVRRSDPVLAPMPLQEVGRHLSAITAGLRL